MTNPFASTPAVNTPAPAADNQHPADTVAPDPAPAAAPAPKPSTAAPAAGAIAQPDGSPAVSNLADMFNNGTTTGGDKLQDELGAAVLIRPTKLVEQMTTQHGPTDAIEADWIVLDGGNQGEVRSGLVFPSVIVNSLKAALERRQLSVGVVARGEAKGGKSAPWLLNALDDSQLALAGQAAQAHGWV